MDSTRTAARSLGIGQAEVRGVLNRQSTVTEVAATHVAALDAGTAPVTPPPRTAR